MGLEQSEIHLIRKHAGSSIDDYVPPSRRRPGRRLRGTRVQTDETSDDEFVGLRRKPVRRMGEGKKSDGRNYYVPRRRTTSVAMEERDEDRRRFVNQVVRRLKQSICAESVDSQLSQIDRLEVDLRLIEAEDRVAQADVLLEDRINQEGFLKHGLLTRAVREQVNWRRERDRLREMLN